MAVAVEEYISPKDWACKRQKYKHNSRRDCHKSCSSGATLRKTIIPKREDYVETRNTLGAPNPIERYFNRLNPSAAKVKENLSDIILKTNPNEIIYTPRYKSDRLTDFCDDVLQYRINLIYKYTKEQYNEAMLWRSRFLSRKKKEFDPDFDHHSNNFIKNNNNNKKNKDWEGKKNAYMAPIINEPAIGLGKGNKKSKVFHTPDSTPKNPKCDFILIDFGCNKWLTGFSTTYHWGKEKQLYRSRNNTDPKDEPKLKLLSCVNNYTIDIAYDEQELESNLQKLRSRKKYDNDEDKTQSKRLTKRERSKNNNIIKQTHSKRGKLNKNANKISNDEYLEKLNLNWDRVGTYNGNLDGYYVNLNKEFRVEKTHRVGNDQSRQSSKNGYKNGRLCRYIKVTPLNHETGFNFVPYGLKVDLSGKPIVESLNKRVRNNSNNNNDKEINNTEDSKEDMNSSVDIGAEMNDVEFESYLNQIVRVGERSKIIDENENDSDDDIDGNNNDKSCIVRISITEEGPNLKYSSMEGVSECYSHWGYNYNFDNIRSKRQEDKRYFNCIRKLERSSCKLVE